LLKNPVAQHGKKDFFFSFKFKKFAPQFL